MRRIALLAVLAVLLVAGTSLSAQAAEMVSASVAGDLSYAAVINGTLPQGASFVQTFYLPVTLQSLNDTGTATDGITVTAGTSAVNVSVIINGVTVASNYKIPASTANTWTIADWKAAGVDLSATYIAVNVTALVNSTSETRLNIDANDAALTGNNVTITVSERTVSLPSIRYESSYYTVKDTVRITQNSDFNLTDVKATFTYPNIATSKDVTSYTFGSLNKSEAKSKTLSYQKAGPFVIDIDADTSGSEYEVTMTIYSYEALTADFEFNALEEPWSKYFVNFNKDTLEIELNNKSVDFEDPAGVVSMTKLSLNKGLNKIVFTYTPAEENVTVAYAPVVFETPKPFYEQEVFGIPYFWTLFIIAIAVLIIGIASRR